MSLAAQDFRYNVNEPQSITAVHIQKTYKKNELVYSQKQEALKFYRVTKGIVLIGNISDDGKEIFKTLVHEGQFFGEEAIMGHGYRLNYAQSFAADVEIEEYNASYFWSETSFQKEVLDSIFRTNMGIQFTMESNSIVGIDVRLKKFLIGLADFHAIQLLTGEKMIRLGIRHRELALICNTSRQSISSIISNWQKEGLLKMDRQNIILSSELLD